MAPSSVRRLPLTLLPPKRSSSKRGIFRRTAAERCVSWLSLMVNSFSFSKPLKACPRQIELLQASKTCEEVGRQADQRVIRQGEALQAVAH
eukprot:Skav210038  [mRNA]  locus=scaffold706:131492:132123:- [translate_table: standard]